MEFRQTLRGMGFLLLGYSCLKSHENGLEVVRPRTAAYFSAKEMD